MGRAVGQHWSSCSRYTSYIHKQIMLLIRWFLLHNMSDKGRRAISPNGTAWRCRGCLPTNVFRPRFTHLIQSSVVVFIRAFAQHRAWDRGANTCSPVSTTYKTLRLQEKVFCEQEVCMLYLNVKEGYLVEDLCIIKCPVPSSLGCYLH